MNRISVLCTKSGYCCQLPGYTFTDGEGIRLVINGRGSSHGMWSISGKHYLFLKISEERFRSLKQEVRLYATWMKKISQRKPERKHIHIGPSLYMSQILLAEPAIHVFATRIGWQLVLDLKSNHFPEPNFRNEPEGSNVEIPWIILQDDVSQNCWRSVNRQLCLECQCQILKWSISSCPWFKILANTGITL